MQSNCQVCGSVKWWDLPNPAEGTSITTAGRIIPEPLGKAQCANCGFVQRIHAKFLGLTDYYEQDYAKYYDRPGTTQFHIARYRTLAEWMSSIFQGPAPSNIMDVGCGQGWAMEAMKTIYPSTKIEGLEPSHFNSSIARDKGFTVYETRVNEGESPQKKYDLVYSNNVIQHVTNAREFLVSLKEMVTDNGTIIVTCPDGSLPNIEVLWSDQNFSFLPSHLIDLCNKVGFETIFWFSSPQSPSVPPAQMIFLSKDKKLLDGRTEMTVGAAELTDIYRAKCQYLDSFKQIDSHISSQTEGCERVYNFGASYWSSVLAAYCPNYWPKVSASLVDNSDGGDQSFLEKDVLLSDSIKPTDRDAVVLGTSPSTHAFLKNKLSSSWKNVVAWDNFAIRY